MGNQQRLMFLVILTAVYVQPIN
uniref:Uncharacterized protein n=1 Tax=Arundo donax TaxID=35708 RepID=A0A0A9GML3_ARUDO